MTMVAICHFDDGAIIISDSRASYKSSNALIPNDSLQKILPIGKMGVFCYAGSVSIANKSLQTLYALNKRKECYQYLDSIIRKLPGLLKYAFEHSSFGERRGCLSVIVGGKLVSGTIKFWVLHSPYFNAIPIEKFEVIGSGNVVKSYLEKEFDSIHLSPGLKQKADKLIIGLSSALSAHNVESVGGMFQVVMVSKIGIQPLNHGHIDLDPESPPHSVYVNMENGEWIQHDLSKGRNIPIMHPGKLLSKPANSIKFIDYNLNVPKKVPKWRLNYFIICSGINIAPGSFDFFNPTVIIGSWKYPFTCELLICIGFWGSFGNEKIMFNLESSEGNKILAEIPFDLKFFPEDLDIQAKISLKIDKPGITFIEAKIKDRVLGRRPLYFHRMNLDPKKEVSNSEIEKVNDALTDCVDNVVENGKAELVYFFLCQECEENNTILSVKNQFWIAYWKKYPLPLACYLATAFRLAKGKHFIRVDLVDAASRASLKIDSATIESRSSCLITPVHSKTIIYVPKPGYYFINIYVDDKLLSSSIFIAENEKPQFSFSLPPEQEKEVEDGQLLLLSKRATQKGL